MTIEELSKLSDEELRVRCAELCGWKWTLYNGRVVLFPLSLWKSDPSAQSVNPKDYPDLERGIVGAPQYHKDLNAMHEAEKTLQHVPTARADQRVIYSDALFQLLSQSLGRVALNFDMLHATARQRCIAFILTKQKS